MYNLQDHSQVTNNSEYLLGSEWRFFSVYLFVL